MTGTTFPRAGSFAAAALLALLLQGCTSRIGEEELLRPIPGGTMSEAQLAGAAPVYALTRHSIAAPDGARLHAVLLRQPGASATILYFGGNGFTIERFGAMIAATFAPLGVDLLIVDHRGYGQSEGRPSAAAIETDGLAAFDYLAALPRGQAGRIVVHGQSLGSFIAGHVAANRPAAGVVLESSVTTAEDWVAAATPGALKPFLKVEIAENFKGRGNLANMARIEEPLLILVGSKDDTTPPRLAEALYRASPLPEGHKTIAIVKGAGHDDVLDKAEAMAAYRRFLAGLSGG